MVAVITWGLLQKRMRLLGSVHRQGSTSRSQRVTGFPRACHPVADKNPEPVQCTEHLVCRLSCLKLGGSVGVSFMLHALSSRSFSAKRLVSRLH